MDKFVICPAIIDELDYYRFDDDTVQHILNGQNMLVVGLRRSGKTSFLYKVQRVAKSKGKPCLFFDCGDFFLDEPKPLIDDAVNQIEESPDSIILLDEIETFEGEDPKLFGSLIKACRKRIAVMTCAPKFVLTHNEHDESVQEFFEKCPKHHLGNLSDEEAVALLSQKKREETSTLSNDTINKLLANQDRFPIILQALGSQAANKSDIGITLAGVGRSFLLGLTEKAKNILITAAHNGTTNSDSFEANLLKALGALSYTDNSKELSIAGRTLRDLICQSSEPPSTEAKLELKDSPPSENWELYSRILHLSDLHFGDHCIEKDERTAVKNQLDRLTKALEQDNNIPDVIVVTGDLSWSGHRNELKLAERFLENLAKWLAVSKNIEESDARWRIMIVPGNHEAAWALTNGLKPEETEDWCCYSLAPFANFVNRFHQGTVFWDLEQPCQSRSIEDPSIAFILVSTAHTITQTQKSGKFGNPVKEKVKELLESENVKNARFRIGLIHHNFRQFHDEPSIISDGDSFLMRISRCKPALDLVLHGHVHQGEVDAYLARGNFSISYSAVGSFGVQAGHRPGKSELGIVPNEFALIDLETSGTGRRFITQMYYLNYTPGADWEWESGKKFEPRLL